MLSRYSITLLIFFFLSCCQSTSEKAVHKKDAKNSFVRKIERAHKKNAFLAKKAIKFDLDIEFGGKKRLEGTITLLTDSYKALILLKDSNEIIVIGDDVYHSPSIEKQDKIRFDAYTWSYFFLLPYKLSDSGTIINTYKDSVLNEKVYNTNKLTFESGTGDAPDDWYILYANTKSSLLEVAAYIVTAGKSTQEAEKDPHAIKYSNYSKIDNIPIATEWSFWGWKEKEGLTKLLGNAKISNIEFLSDTATLFEVPEGYLEK